MRMNADVMEKNEARLSKNCEQKKKEEGRNI